MKNNLLFCLCLLFIIPTITIGAEIRTLEVEFSFINPDDSAKQLLGYRLYKEGEQVCETNDPNAFRMSCEIYTEDGTFDFSLTAYYPEGVESPHSHPFSFTIGSTTDTPTDAGTFSPEPPTAVLSSTTGAGNAPLNVTFDGTSSTASNPPIVSYSWEFGDGSQATGETASHTFTTAGTYYSQLTVVDSQGLSDTFSTPIVVTVSVSANEKPIAVLTTGAPSVDAPLTFSFDGSQSSDPDGSITQYSWNFGDGTTGSGPLVLHTYSSAGVYTVSLQVKDDRDEKATAGIEITCNTSLPNNINIEVGEVSIDHNWVTVAFENTFSQPVVITGPPTVYDAEPVLVRIRNINKTGFQVRLQEWDYQDGTHATETFSYIVIEKGIYTLENGIKIEAGNFTGTSSFSEVSLQQLYDFTPVILTQVITENETDAVTGRVRNPNQDSFEFKVQEMEKTATAHLPETIGYIAWEPGKGEISGLLYEIGTTAKIVDYKWFDLTFKTDFPDLPFFIAGMQTDVYSWTSSDTAKVRSQNLSPAATQIKIEEEQSQDREVWHPKEVVGYFTLGVAGATPVQP